MSDQSIKPNHLLAGLAGTLLVVYSLVAGAAALYFNYTFARDNGFVRWVFFGEIVSTAKGAVWPYFVLTGHRGSTPQAPPSNITTPMTEAAPSYPPPAANAPAASHQYMPRSVGNFLFGLDALTRADERPPGIEPTANLLRVRGIFAEAIDSAATIDRGQLDAVFPGLSDHFFDGAVRHMRLMVQGVDNRDQIAFTGAIAAFVAWQRWWNANQAGVMELIAQRYSR